MNNFKHCVAVVVVLEIDRLDSRIDPVPCSDSRYTGCLGSYIYCALFHCSLHSYHITIKITNIRNDSQGRVSFFMYFDFFNGILPGNLLDHFVRVRLQSLKTLRMIHNLHLQEGRNEFLHRGFTIVRNLLL